MNYDEVGKLKIFTKTIYLNSLFINEHFALTDNPKYNLPRLVYTIAHEIAHCLRADYEPKEAAAHDIQHAVVTYCLEYLILKTYEYHLLEQLSKLQRKNSTKPKK